MQEYVDIPILQGSVVRKKANRAKTVYIDVNFQSANETALLDAVIFQNYYSSSVTITQLNSLQEYVVILENFVLMADAHSEEKSQTWFTLNASQFNGNYVHGRNMRFTLFQPDITWQRFEIQNIRLVSKIAKAQPLKTCNVLTSANLLQMISADWALLNDAAQAQKNLIDVPEINFTMADYKRSIKKKEKKKDKKGSTSQAAANDDFGIAIPSFPKNPELPDNV